MPVLRLTAGDHPAFCNYDDCRTALLAAVLTAAPKAVQEKPVGHRYPQRSTCQNALIKGMFTISVYAKFAHEGMGE